jgi:hypothetical protein
MQGNRHGPKTRRKVTRANAKPSTHTGPGPWVKGYDHRMELRCEATTVREPDDPRWSPEQPDTYVRASCSQAASHRGWHVSEDGYAWHPEDDAQYVLLPTT